MDKYHVIGIAEAQVRSFGGSIEELERIVGRAVLGICENGGEDRVEDVKPLIVVDHLDATEFNTERARCRLWMWEIGGFLCMADLSQGDVDLAMKLAYAVQIDQHRRRALA